MLSSVSSEASLSGSSLLATTDSFEEYQQGFLLSVDRTKIPYKNYDQWQFLMEECKDAEIFAVSTPAKHHYQQKIGNFDSKIFGRLTQSFVESEILKAEGDFCIWKQFDETFIFSVKAKAAWFHFRIATNHDGFFIASVYGVVGETLEKLIHKLLSSPIDIMSLIAETTLLFKRMIAPHGGYAKLFAKINDVQEKRDTTVKSCQFHTFNGLHNDKPIVIYETVISNAANFDNIFQELSIALFLTRSISPASSMFYLPYSVQIESAFFQRLFPQTAYGNLEVFAKTHDMHVQMKLECIHQISVALSELHRLNIIHCNIRPKNIFVDQCSKAADEQLQFLVGGFEEAVIGVPTKPCNPFINPHLRMLAPEVFESLRFTKQSDVYAFGVTMWEIFAGRKHCNGETPKDIVKNGLQYTLKEFGYQDSIPSKIIDLINQCCNGDATKRPTMNGVWMKISQIYRQTSKKK